MDDYQAIKSSVSRNDLVSHGANSGRKGDFVKSIVTKIVHECIGVSGYSQRLEIHFDSCSLSREATLFGCGRSSPIWHVSEAAKTAEERERTLQLAQPKKTHSLYQPERCVAWPVSAGARRAVASARVEHLARPKSRNDGLLRDPMWRVSSASRRVVASARVHELARPKQLAEGYQPCRDTEWAVPRGALRGAPSERVQVLSKPIIRETMDHVQFNPDAFTVSEAAKKAAISQRIVELAQPLSRGHK